LAGFRYTPIGSTTGTNIKEPTLSDYINTLVGRIVTSPAPGTVTPPAGEFVPANPSKDLLNQLEGVVPGQAAPTAGLPTLPYRPGLLSGTTTSNTFFGLRLPEYVLRRLRSRTRAGLSPRR
jgi:hypothetical protein